MRVLIAIAGVASCYHPSVAPCQYACASGGACPEGLTCQTTGNMCVAHAEDTCSDGGLSLDGPPATACTLFAPAQLYGAEATPRSVAIGKLDTDGTNDVVVGASTFNAFVFYRNTAGTLSGSNLVVSSGVMGIAILPSAVGNEVAISQLSSPNDFVEPYKYATGSPPFVPNGSVAIGAMTKPGAFAVADFNQDTYFDLAVVDTGTTAVTILAGSPSGGVAPFASISGLAGHPLALSAGDLNGDQRPDLVIVNDNYTYQVAIATTDPTAYKLSAAVNIAGLPVAVALANLDADRTLDLVIVSGAIVELAHGIGDGTFAMSSRIAAIALPRGLAIGDFDRDGNPDLAITSSMDDTVTVIEGNGDGTFRMPVAVPVGNNLQTWAIAAGDLDGDGHDDLAITCSSSNQLAVMLDTCVR